MEIKKTIKDYKRLERREVAIGDDYKLSIPILTENEKDRIIRIQVLTRIRTISKERYKWLVCLTVKTYISGFDNGVNVATEYAKRFSNGEVIIGHRKEPLRFVHAYSRAKAVSC